MSNPSESLPPDRAGSPSSLLVTFAGAYLRRIGRWIAVADLVDLLGSVGVPDPAVRQAVRRLRSRGFFAAEKRRGTAGYAITGDGLADLEPGDRRIFRYGQADLADGWVLAVFSVPESERARRHQLRTQLGWLGFGTVGSGVWAAPAAMTEPARALLAASGLERFVTYFHARALDPVDPSAWWRLDELRAQYAGFVETWQPATIHASEIPDVDAFAGFIRLLDAWRLFPRVDPGLPAELLPPDWPGPIAWTVFSTLRAAWEERGLSHVRTVVGG